MSNFNIRLDLLRLQGAFTLYKNFEALHPV